MASKLREMYIKNMMSSEEGKQLFEEYKELFGRYPGIYLDATKEESLEFIKEEIKQKKKNNI